MGNPLTLISALAYVLQRNAGIGLSREEIRCAFGSNTTMGHLIPRMKNFVAQGNAGLVRTTNSHIQGVSDSSTCTGTCNKFLALQAKEGRHIPGPSQANDASVRSAWEVLPYLWKRDGIFPKMH